LAIFQIRYSSNRLQQHLQHANFSRLNGSMTFAWFSSITNSVGSSRRSISASLRRTLCGLALLSLAAGLSAQAQGTKLWTQSRFDEFEKGTPQGVQITSDGKLRKGPETTEVLTTPSSFVWSVAADKAGTAYLATGSPATVLRIAPNHTSTKLFETKAVAVQVVRLGPDGALYAATIPDGKVYRLKTDSTSAVDETTAQVVFDLGKIDTDNAKGTDAKTDGKARYIWDMTFDQAGKLYIATGGPGMVYRVDVNQSQPSTEVFFKSDEQHIRALAWDKTGNLIAGTDGSGLVYRISPEGKGYVLFSAPRREITAVAVGSDGTVYASDVGDKNKNPLPQLPVQSGSVGITISFVQPASMQAANASTVLPEGTEIYSLTPNAAPRKLWVGKDEIVYQLAATTDGLTVLTGNRGRIFTIHTDGSYGDVAHLDAQQAITITAIPRGWLLGTANTGKLYFLQDITHDPGAISNEKEHSYASDVLDAGAMSRWGRIEVDPGSNNYEIWTRTGNVEQPARREKDWGWSEWQPTANGKIASPTGRYLQWKAVLNSAGVVSGVGVNYLPVNSAPVVDDLMVVPGARVTQQNQQPGQQATVMIAFPNPNTGVVYDGNSGNATAPIQAQKDRTAVTVRWNAHDDDSDDLSYDLYLRGDGEHTWRPLKKALTDKVYSFDGASFPDGGYQIKVVASDAPSHAPSDVLTGEMISERFELDTTPPVISGLKAGAAVPGDCKQPPCPLNIPVDFDTRDAASPVSHAEYSLDAGPWQYIEPVGSLADSKEEHYSVLIPLPAAVDGKTDGDSEPEHLITVRAYDRHDNMATAKVLVPAKSKEK
jgi:hypothetical protein